jgi:hypothetical protein
MEETGELEILEIISVDILCHSDIGRSIEHPDAMFWIVIWVVFAAL